jgi:TPR repeat protein
MLRLGLAAYQGSASHVVDVDAAHQWLSKAVKALLGINNLSTVSVDLTRERVFLWRANKESSKPMPSIVCLHISDLWRYRRQECQEELLSQQGEVANTGAKSEGPQAAGEPRQQQELRPRLVQNGAVQSSGQTPSVSCRALLSQRAQAYVSAGHLAIAYTDEATLSAALGRAAMILAYMAFDGEGMRADKEQACNLFKLAAVCGCREAARVLGWLFSTGQYGF